MSATIPPFVIRCRTGVSAGKYVKRGGGTTEDLTMALITRGKGYQKWDRYPAYELLEVQITLAPNRDWMA